MNKKRQTAAAVLAISLMCQNGMYAYGGQIREEFREKNREAAPFGMLQFQKEKLATPAEIETVATSSDAIISNETMTVQKGVLDMDQWKNWNGDFSFLDGTRGDGSEEHPYRIGTAAQLKALSIVAAMGMKIPEEFPELEYLEGDYSGSHFVLEKDLDLDGLDWNPIGYCDAGREKDDGFQGFEGYFHGNGHKVTGFRVREELPCRGFFGLVTNGGIDGLTLVPEGVITGTDRVGILAGQVTNSVIKDCRAKGEIAAEGDAGGIVGIAEVSILENCLADVVISSEGSDSFVGGIAGQAKECSVVDCETTTGDNHTSRIRGKGTVGGIVGLQEDSAIYNVRVTGTVGGSGSQVIGGITGRYAGGNLKVARFEGSIGNSGLGGQGRKGAFLGTRENDDYFRYGDQVAWLFADREEVIAANVCGSEIPGDNLYSFEDHIGYFHKGDLYYTLTEGSRTREITERYFYEELEDGILQIMDGDNSGALPADLGYTIDHVTAGESGRPVRGYLVTIPQIDVASELFYHEDVAVLEAKGAGAYGKRMDKDRRGAVAAGKTVTVYTAPKNSEKGLFQMEGVPTYTKGETREKTSKVGAGEYVFTMPAEDTEISAVYTKVAASVDTEPDSCRISVIQERTGNRKSPVEATRIYGPDGKLIATYINGELEHGTVVYPIHVAAQVEGNNDVSDTAVRWSVDDPELIRLLPNQDEDEGGYTKQSASLEVNLEAGFFQDTIEMLERKQAESGYRERIPDTLYGAGGQGGGVAVVTASTWPSASYEGKVRTANCDILVTFQVQDRTYMPVEGVVLDQAELEFTVTRQLTGSRYQQREEIKTTAPKILTAVFAPDFFSKKEVTWSAGDDSQVRVYAEEDGYKSAVVSVVSDAKWIRDIMAVDDAVREQNKDVRLTGSGEQENSIMLVAEDMLGNRQVALCQVRIRFVTDDRTYGNGSGSGSSGGSAGGGSSSGSSGGTSPGTGHGGIVLGPAAGLSDTGMAAMENSGEIAEGVRGVWSQDEDGSWRFNDGVRDYEDEWAYLWNPYGRDGQETAWFAFDENGRMRTGWYQDDSGNWFYLSPESDGALGHMVTGWSWINGACYYFNPVSDGTKGRLYRSEQTPDGFETDHEGRWIIDGRVQSV